MSDRPKTITCFNCGGAKSLVSPVAPGEPFRCRTCSGVGRLTAAAVTFADLVNLAATDLPPGWQITLQVGHHEGSVTLTGPDGEDVEFATNHDGIEEEWVDALDAAIDGAREPLTPTGGGGTVSVREAAESLHEHLKPALYDGYSGWVQAVGEADASPYNDTARLWVYLVRKPMHHEGTVPTTWHGYPVETKVVGGIVVRAPE